MSSKSTINLPTVREAIAIVAEELDFLPDDTFARLSSDEKHHQYNQMVAVNKKIFKQAFGADAEAQKNVFPGALFAMELDQTVAGGFVVGINEEKFEALLRSPNVKPAERRSRNQLLGLEIGAKRLLESNGVTESKCAAFICEAWMPCIEVYRSGLSMLLETAPRAQVSCAPTPKPRSLHTPTVSTPVAYTLLLVLLHMLLAKLCNKNSSKSSAGAKEAKSAEEREILRKLVTDKLAEDRKVAMAQLLTYFSGPHVEQLLSKEETAMPLIRLALHQYAVQLLNALETAVMRLMRVPSPMFKLLSTPPPVPVDAHCGWAAQCDHFGLMVAQETIEHRFTLRAHALGQLHMYASCADDAWNVPAVLPVFPLEKRPEPEGAHRWNRGHLICQLSLLPAELRANLSVLASRLYVSLADGLTMDKPLPDELYDAMAYPYTLDATRQPPGPELEKDFEAWAVDFTRFLEEAQRGFAESKKEGAGELFQKVAAPDSVQVETFRAWFDRVIAGGYVGWPTELVPVERPGSNDDDDDGGAHEAAAAAAPASVELQMEVDPLALAAIFEDRETFLPFEIPMSAIKGCTNAVAHSLIIVHYVRSIVKSREAEQAARTLIAAAEAKDAEKK